MLDPHDLYFVIITSKIAVFVVFQSSNYMFFEKEQNAFIKSVEPIYIYKKRAWSHLSLTVAVPSVNRAAISLFSCTSSPGWYDSGQAQTGVIYYSNSFYIIIISDGYCYSLRHAPDLNNIAAWILVVQKTHLSRPLRVMSRGHPS